MRLKKVRDKSSKASVYGCPPFSKRMNEIKTHQVTC